MKVVKKISIFIKKAKSMLAKNLMIKIIKKVAQNLSKTYWLMLCAILPSQSHAQSIENIITRVTNYLQGSLARSFGVLCIIIAGYLCLYRQKFPKEYFAMILVGLGIIFGGSSLYNTFIG